MKYHFIGIGGIGMSALAKILRQRGAEVQGTDLAHSYITDDLIESGVEVFSYHSAEHIPSACTVIYNTLIQSDHPEYHAAATRQMPLLHRSDLLAELMRGYRTLLVTGTHGKTTTSCLLAHVMQVAGQQPSYALGGVALNFESNGAHGEGNYFVAEADESDGTFLKYHGYGAIITNIEEDHLSYWKTKDALIEGFRLFANQVDGYLWWNRDDPILTALELKGKSFGFGPHADLKIDHWRQEGWKIVFAITYRGKTYSDLEIPLLGKHNVYNAVAVLGLALDLGVDIDLIRRGFQTFKGVKRRMEKKGEKRGVQFFDDYAHHPTEIATTLRGVRQAIGEKRLIAVFQPHRYTRLTDCWNGFLECFNGADGVIVTDVYGSGEKPIPNITAGRFCEELKAKVDFPVVYAARDRVIDQLIQWVRPHDVVITLGAGDITYVGHEAAQQEIKPYRVAICTGGKSAEHEVALRSANVVLQSMNPDYYQTSCFIITKEGEWLIEGQTIPFPEVVRQLLSYDLAFPVLHGPFGEDGMIQGFFETLGVPYVGPDFRSCAVSMDKAWTKHLAARHGVEVAPFIEFYTYDWENNREAVLAQIVERFTFPFYIKAVHLGSTFGVHRIKSKEQIDLALDSICKLDYRFLVEEEVIGRELEFGFIGNFDVDVSDPAEVTRADEIHTYENKYSAKGNPSIPKAPMPPEILDRGRKAAKAVYQAVGCTGCARIDFFLKSDGTWVLSEVNPIPGFTPTSVYPVIWKAEGVDFPFVIDRMIIGGLHRKRYYDRHLRPPLKPPVLL